MVSRNMQPNNKSYCYWPVPTSGLPEKAPAPASAAPTATKTTVAPAATAPAPAQMRRSPRHEAEILGPAVLIWSLYEALASLPCL